jgi:hypothetical protein
MDDSEVHHELKLGLGLRFREGIGWSSWYLVRKKNWLGKSITSGIMQ